MVDVMLNNYHKRAKKFNAKGGPKALLSQKGHSLTKKGKTKGKPKSSTTEKTKGQREGEERMRADLEKSARERERAEKDFVGTEENLGSLDIESFFEKAVQVDWQVEIMTMAAKTKKRTLVARLTAATVTRKMI